MISYVLVMVYDVMHMVSYNCDIIGMKSCKNDYDIIGA
jgi:hypothetical protein